MRRGTFVTLFAALMGLEVLIFLVSAHLLGRIPDRFINLPAREYWLAPEHHDDAIATIRENLLWMGTCTLAFFDVVYLHVYVLNLQQHPHAGLSFWLALAGYLLILFALMLRLTRSFRIAPDVE
jgi:hypothetical protein